MKQKIILDLCGGTGAWSRPYKEMGYDVRNITLPEYDVRTYQPPENVYGILAAPPCTEFSVAKTVGKPRNLKKGIEIVYHCLRIIWEAQYKLEKPFNRHTTLKFWALENPKGLLEYFLGKPTFQFQPYEFGDNYSKKTCLWGKFNEPQRNLLVIKPQKRTMSDLVEPMTFKRDFKKMAEVRSITPKGFAEAFFRANQ